MNGWENEVDLPPGLRFSNHVMFICFICDGLWNVQLAACADHLPRKELWVIII